MSGDNKKPMDIFGENWRLHHEKIRENWENTVSGDDLVLVPGDISWAMSLEDAMPDLEWLAKLPGRKVIIKGNHDFWWSSLSKVRAVLHPSIMAIQNDSVTIDGIAITGTRLWQDSHVDFSESIQWAERENMGLAPERMPEVDEETLFQREISRLNLSLESVSEKARKIITMLHFPPTDFRFRETRTTTLLQKFGVELCVFGHLHSLRMEMVPKFPVRKWGIDFYLASSDYLDFKLVQIQ